MTRRNFLRAVGVAAAALVADPELALWKPKTHFLPPAHGWKHGPTVRYDKKSGISVQITRSWEVAASGLSVPRIDVLYGFATLRPQYAGRLIA